MTATPSPIDSHQTPLVLNSEAKRVEMVNWLSNEPWDAFLTITQDMNGTIKGCRAKLLTEETRIWKPARLAHPEQVEKRFSMLRNTFNNARYGRNWRKNDQKAMSAVYAIERHKSSSAHGHALLRIPGGITQQECEYWQKIFTGEDGYCKLEIPRDQEDVLSYVAGYVTKKGEVGFTPNFESQIRQGSFDELRKE